MKMVYIASPLRGDYNQNIKNAVEYCRNACDMGVMALAPFCVQKIDLYSCTRTGKACSAFTERGALNFRKACTIASEYPVTYSIM